MTARVASILGYAGLLPFLLGAVFSLHEGEYAALAQRALAYYALAILCFLAGAWWGIALLRRSPAILIASNVLVVAAWAAVLFVSYPYALLTLGALLVISAIVEGRHPLFAPQPAYYRALRLRLTGVAAIALVFASVVSAS